MSIDVPSRRSPPRRGLLIAGVAALAVAALVVVTGVARRMHETSEVKTWTDTQSIPVVKLVAMTGRTGGRALVLPGDLQAFYNAQIYPRVPGYVHAWYVDIGARVKAHQLLATIDTPELDQQIAQAKAEVATAEANRTLAATTAARWARLLTQDAVSKQETDEKSGDLAAKTAQVAAVKANLDRLTALKGFARIVAPFDGVVTARHTDIGALVNAGSGATSSTELFDVSRIDKLRLYVRVPQVSSAEIRPGVKVSLTVPELPGRTFPAALDTTANAISDSSGTLLSEFLVDNTDGVLKPGAYAEVSFAVPAGGRDTAPHALVLPTSALLFRGQGLQVAVADSADHVHLKTVVAGRNFGQTIEISSGLQPGDRVIDNPPDSLAEGQLVRAPGKDSAPHAGG